MATSKKTDAHGAAQQRLLGSILTNMVQLDFIHLAILSVNLSEHQFNILQHQEIERLKALEKLRSSDPPNGEDQPLQ